MERLIRQSHFWGSRLVWWAAKVPVVGARVAYRSVRHVAGAWTLATRDALPCSACGHAVALLGRWQCGRCGFVFDGFGFASCRACDAPPPLYLPCPTCGVGLKNPVHPARQRHR